jgi:hypothetical protein
MHGWIDPFYEPAGAAIEPGQIWSGHALELPAREALRIDRVNPKDDSKVDFTLAPFGPEAFAHPPVHSLRLSAGEAIAVTRAVHDRPLIVLGGTTTTQLDAGGTVIVVPLFEAATYDEPARRRIAAYAYANAFYLPSSTRPAFPESLARLDQTQPVLRELLTGHHGLRLSADALDALVEWFVAFTTNRLPADSLILEYRREMLAQL